MEQLVSVTEANKILPELVQGVKEGHHYVLTSQGRPVALLLPVDANRGRLAGARKTLLTHLQQQSPAEVSPWTREDLYEDTL